MKNDYYKNVSVIERIQLDILKNNIFKNQSKILVGMSGGQDSICSVLFFFLLKVQWQLKFGLITCNHFWQKDSFYSCSHSLKIAYVFDESFSLSLCPIWLSCEQDGRKWRYSVFRRIGYFYFFSFISIAHTETDRVETLFFQLLRGSGISGILGIQWKRKIKKAFPKNKEKSLFYRSCEFLLNYENVESRKKCKKQKFRNTLPFASTMHRHVPQFRDTKLFQIPTEIQFCESKFFFIRPLLGITRFHTNLFCKGWRLPIYSDRSNQFSCYTRNCIRQQLLPLLKKLINPRLERTVSQFADIILQENLYIEKIIKKLKYILYFSKKKTNLFFLEKNLERKKTCRFSLITPLGVRRPPPRRDMNIQGFAGHPRPSRGAECSYPVPLKGSDPPRGDMNIQGVAIEPLFTQSEANEGGTAKGELKMTETLSQADTLSKHSRVPISVRNSKNLENFSILSNSRHSRVPISFVDSICFPCSSFEEGRADEREFSIPPRWPRVACEPQFLQIKNGSFWNVFVFGSFKYLLFEKKLSFFLPFEKSSFYLPIPKTKFSKHSRVSFSYRKSDSFSCSNLDPSAGQGIPSSLFLSEEKDLPWPALGSGYGRMDERDFPIQFFVLIKKNIFFGRGWFFESIFKKELQLKTFLSIETKNKILIRRELEKGKTNVCNFLIGDIKVSKFCTYPGPQKKISDSLLFPSGDKFSILDTKVSEFRNTKVFQFLTEIPTEIPFNIQFFEEPLNYFSYGSFDKRFFISLLSTSPLAIKRRFTKNVLENLKITKINFHKIDTFVRKDISPNFKKIFFIRQNCSTQSSKEFAFNKFIFFFFTYDFLYESILNILNKFPKKKKNIIFIPSIGTLFYFL
jgi:tRNA(Ile)-lysidine synthase TilS/MesJ